jgi:cyclic pyranopterin phosphate synthase
MKAKLISQPRSRRVDLCKYIPLKTPFVIYIEPSGYCNLRCVFCPQTSKEKGMVRDMMTLKLWKKAIDDLLEFPEKIKLLRVCGNGEPLTNPHLVKMLHYANLSPKIERIELII